MQKFSINIETSLHLCDLIPGTCLYLVKRVSKVNGYRCHHFRNGCHNASILSDRIYKCKYLIDIKNNPKYLQKYIQISILHTSLYTQFLVLI